MEIGNINVNSDDINWDDKETIENFVFDYCQYEDAIADYIEFYDCKAETYYKPIYGYDYTFGDANADYIVTIDYMGDDTITIYQVWE